MQTLRLSGEDCRFLHQILVPDVINRAFHIEPENENDNVYVFKHDGTSLSLPKEGSDKDLVHALQVLATMLDKPVLVVLGELAMAQNFIWVPILSADELQQMYAVKNHQGNDDA